MRLTWRKFADNSFRRLPDGARLHLDGKHIASVSPVTTTRLGSDVCGWMWSAPEDERLGISFRNTYAEPAADRDEAKDQCEAYIRQCLGLPQKKARKP